MSENFFISESGRLLFREKGAELAEKLEHSPGEGFLFLVRTPPPSGAGCVYYFFRSLAEDFLQAFLRSGTPGEISPERIAAAPPVAGEELTAERVRAWMEDLLMFVRKEAEREGKSPDDYLRLAVPAWKEVAHIHFHLAENARDADGLHPFVFLATYPHRTGALGELKHLPLGTALRKYADDKPALLSLLEPIRDASKKSPFLAGLLENQSLFRPCAWTAREAYNFVHDTEIFQESGIRVRLNRPGGRRNAKLKLQLTLEADARPKGVPLTEMLLRFSAVAAIGNTVLTPEELAALAKTGGGLLRIKGEWVEADPEQVRSLLRQWEAARDLSMPFLQGLRIYAGLGRNDGVPMPRTDSELCDIRMGPELTEILSQETAAETVVLPENTRLRPYQVEGVRFLLKMGALGLGACLADDMGLGKTLQVLICLETLRKGNKLSSGAALGIAPASLLGNWKTEAAKFTPELRFGILHPSEEGSVESFRADPKGYLAEYDLVMTSYPMTLRLPELAEMHFPLVFLDEAQNIKNPAAAQSLAARKLHADRRIALTGTPVENGTSDLWSIFDFLTPGLLGTFPAFRDFVKSLQDHPQDGKNAYAPLRKLIRPCLLRRLKTDRSILPDLPDKTEVRTWCFLTKLQAEIYQRSVNRMRLELEMADDRARSGVILSFLTQFKQICNHPSQFTGNGDFSTERSGKFQRLRDLASDIARRGDKMIVFTQFREMIDPLHELLTGVFGRPGLVLHGGTPVPERATAVAAFQSEAGPPFFVLSLRAAGTGLTLTAANHVVHFDRWWNPAVENQATDRAFRIGQHRNVLVHKFVCRGTLEEKIDAMIDSKRSLSDALLSGGAEKLLTDMNNRELLDFVRLELPGNDEEN